MSIVPANKQDFEACQRLAAASDDEVRTRLCELLVWLQDMNWPVAPLVTGRVAKVGLALTTPLREILRGSDEVWKYWIVSSLLATADSAVAESLREELDRIVTSPTLGEVREELPDAVRLLRQESTMQ
jgi:hypothetical protein